MDILIGPQCTVSKHRENDYLLACVPTQSRKSYRPCSGIKIAVLEKDFHQVILHGIIVNWECKTISHIWLSKTKMIFLLKSKNKMYSTGEVHRKLK